MPFTPPQPIPLNEFKVVTKKIVNEEDTFDIYETPENVAGIVLLCQIANLSNSPKRISAKVRVAGKDAEGELTGTFSTVILVKEFTIPPNDAFNPLTGRLVLTVGDIFQITSHEGDSELDVTFSILENALE